MHLQRKLEIVEEAQANTMVWQDEAAASLRATAAAVQDLRDMMVQLGARAPSPREPEARVAQGTLAPMLYPVCGRAQEAEEASAPGTGAPAAAYSTRDLDATATEAGAPVPSSRLPDAATVPSASGQGALVGEQSDRRAGWGQTGDPRRSTASSNGGSMKEGESNHDQSDGTERKEGEESALHTQDGEAEREPAETDRLRI